MSRFLFALCCFSFFAAGGCATVLRSDTQKVKFDVQPAGATMDVDGTKYTAPTEVPLKRNKPHSVVVWADGYRPISFKITSTFDGLSLLNEALPGGTIGLATDTVTGADKAFSDTVKIQLPKADTPTTEPLVEYEFNGQVMGEREYKAAVAARVAELKAREARKNPLKPLG